MKRLITVFIAINLCWLSHYADAQDVLIQEVLYNTCPGNDKIMLCNTSDGEIDMTGWQLCSRFNYASIASLTIESGSLPLQSDECIILSGFDFDDSAADVGLYSSTSFGSATAMVDFVQYGTAVDVGRVDVAVNKGIWTEISPDVFDFVASSAVDESLQFDGTNGGGGEVSLSTDFINTTPEFEPEPFITSWQVEANDTIIIPLQSGTYDFDFLWTLTTDNSIQISGTHVNADGRFETAFVEAGIYELEIVGDFPHLAGYPKAKLLDVLQWGDIEWRSMASMFEGWPGASFSAQDTIDLSRVTNMRLAFARAENFNDDLNHWDVSTVTDMRLLFNRASSFNGDISDWNVSNVRLMQGLFKTATSFNQDIGDWDVSRVTVMNEMFSSASRFNQDISNWDVSNVQNMQAMFRAASRFNQPIGKWDVRSVTTMREMFPRATSFDQSLGDWQFNQVLRNNNNNRTLAMFSRVPFSCESWSSTLIGWEFNNPDLTSMLVIANFEYDTIAAVALDSLIARGWNMNGTAVEDNCNAAHPCDDDVRAPMPTALPDIVGECEATITDPPVATDLCQGDITGVTADPITYDSQGVYIVTWTFDDGFGNIALAEQRVIVDDTTTPVPDIETLQNITGVCDVSVTAPTATDNCEGEITGTTDQFIFDEQGTFTITWTYDDGHGNASTQMQTVIVGDLTAPTITMTDGATILVACDATTFEDPGAVASDNCTGVEIITTGTVDINTPGTYTLTYQAVDVGGNESEELIRTVIVPSESECSDCISDLVITAADLAADPHASVFSADNSITIDGVITTGEQILLSAPNGVEFLGSAEAQMEVENGAQLDVNLESCSSLLSTLRLPQSGN